MSQIKRAQYACWARMLIRTYSKTVPWSENIHRLSISTCRKCPDISWRFLLIQYVSMMRSVRCRAKRRRSIGSPHMTSLRGIVGAVWSFTSKVMNLEDRSNRNDLRPCLWIVHKHDLSQVGNYWALRSTPLTLPWVTCSSTRVLLVGITCFLSSQSSLNLGVLSIELVHTVGKFLSRELETPLSKKIPR